MDTMHKVWDKLDYRLDIRSVIHRPHIESLWDVHKTFEFFYQLV
jgi:hypothetical protein